MKLKIISLFIISIILTSCRKEIKPSFDKFLFITSTINGNIALKFSLNDTIFKQTQLPDKNLESSFTILNATQKDSLVEFINMINSHGKETKHFSLGLDENDSQVIIIEKDKDFKFFTNYNYTSGKEINQATNWLKDFAMKNNFVTSKEKDDFWNTKGIEHPIPPPPSKVHKIKFENNGF